MSGGGPTTMFPTAPTVLFLTASPRPASFSRRVGAELVSRLTEGHPHARVVHRDLASEPAAAADAAFHAAVLGGGADDDPAFVASEVLIGELVAADALVIATPMHNYTVPASLKAWIDQVLRIRRTFASTPTGKQGLLADRPCWIVVASGGWFTGPSPVGTPPQPDFLTPYLRAVLATMGIGSVETIALEGATRGVEQAEMALAAARARIAEIPGLRTPR